MAQDISSEQNNKITNTFQCYFGSSSQAYKVNYDNGENERAFTITNKREYPLKAKITGSGQLAEWVFINETRFIIDPQSNKTVMAYVYPPGDAEHGLYEGNLRIVLTKKLI